MWTKRGQDHFFDRIFTASALHPPTSKNPVTVGISGFYSFFHRNSDSHGSAHHGVVAHAQEAHHLHVCGDGAGAGELRVRVHTAHSVGHAEAGGAGGHIVGMQRAARAAAGGRRGGGLDVWKRTRNGQKLSDIWKQFRLQAQ